MNFVDPSGHKSNPIRKGYYYPNNAWNSLKPYEKLNKTCKLFILLIAGEAIGENMKSWKAVAHIIMNRVKDKK